MVLLSVGVLLRKDHTFRSEHISENKLMLVLPRKTAKQEGK